MRLEEIHRRYGDVVQFYVVYIQEAHPSDGWQMGLNEREGIDYRQPTTMDERAAIAGACELRLDFSMPMLIDAMTNEVDEAYSALPDRLYLIDGDGRIAYRGERGPMGFRPDEFESSIRSHLLDGKAV